MKTVKDEIENSNEKESTELNGVFTKKVRLINPVVYFFTSVLNAIWKLVKWLLDLVLSMFSSIFHFVKMVGIGIYNGVIGIVNFFKRKAHQYKYNDKAGRLSFFLFGYSSFSHKQYVNGVLFALFEVLYIVLFALFGANSIYMLTFGKLGLVPTQEVCYDGFCELRIGDNSIMILIYGLLWILSIFLFIYIWNRSINMGYYNYRIDEFIKFEKIDKSNVDMAKHLDEEAKKAFDAGISSKKFLADHQKEIEDYISKIEDVKEKDYTKYLLVNTCKHSFVHLKKVKKQEAIIAKAELKKEKLIVAREKGLETKKQQYEQKKAAYTGDDEEYLDKLYVKVEKYENSTMLKVANCDKKISHQKHVLEEILKRYSTYVEMQHTRNNDRYGKFNDYYKHVADLDLQLVFYRNYRKFVELYFSKLDKFGEANEENAKAIVKLGEEMNEKIKTTRENFNAIREKKKVLEAELTQVKVAYKEEVNAIKASGEENQETRLLEAKAKLVDSTTAIMRRLNDLPTDKNINLLEKEEIKESKNAYVRDKKFLKTNYKSEEYARKEVIDLMLVDYHIDYKDAVKFVDNLFVSDDKNKCALSEEELQCKINSLENEKNEYVAKHPDNYVGKPKSFKESMKSLFNDKFHITILSLPIIGIVFISIVPLLFSILVAFTNYSSKNYPPTQLFTWIGLENFFSIFNPAPDSVYAVLPQALLKTVRWTLIWAIVATFSNYILGIVVALMINKDGIKLKKLWRTIFMMTVAIPQFISLLSIGILLKDTGAVGQIFHLGFGSDSSDQGVLIAKIIIIIVNIWVGIPYTILSTTGILLNIPKDLYESAKVDGAGTFTQFTKITMPYILFVTGPYLITQFVGNINNFNVIYFLTGGGPAIRGSGLLGLGQTDLLITFLYKIITSNNADYGLASTIGIVIFIICSFISIVMYNKSNSIKEEDQFQ